MNQTRVLNSEQIAPWSGLRRQSQLRRTRTCKAVQGTALKYRRIILRQCAGTGSRPCRHGAARPRCCRVSVPQQQPLLSTYFSTDLLRAGGEQEEIDFIRLAKGEVLGPRSTAGAAADSGGNDRTSVISSGAAPGTGPQHWRRPRRAVTT
jgi:hypothetical protein